MSSSLYFSPYDKSLDDIHEPEHIRKFAVKPLLSIIEDIFQPVTPAVPGFGLETQLPLGASKDESFQSGNFIDVNGLSAIIHEISGKISSKFSDGTRKHVTGEIFQIVRHYDWDAKVVLVLAAFAFNYAEFWLLAQPYSTNSLARSFPLLKQLPETSPSEHVDTLKPKFEELSNLVKAILDITKCICIIHIEDIKHDPEALPCAVYWTIRNILACASQIMSLVGMGYKNIPAAEAKRQRLAGHLREFHDLLRKQLTNHQKSIEGKRRDDKYEELVSLIETPHENNMKVLKALIYDKEDMLPLLKGSTKTRVSMEVLMRKHVLLLISNLSLPYNEIFMLTQKYQELGEDSFLKRINSQLETVWLPVVDEATPWTHAKQDQFVNLQLKMPWYSVYHPSMIGPTVIMYIKKVWQFDNKPILVVLDPQGKVINNNALHMLWIWGSLAFPFTRAREKELWKKEETWTVEFLVDGIDPTILIWIKENKYICLYGGEDIDWIRKFTSIAKEVARAARIPLEILYVGESNPQETVRQNISTIGVEGENLSYSMQDLSSIWYFWVRLGSMRQSKKILGKSRENDPIMQEIESLLSFDGKNQSWAMFCTSTGSAMAKAGGETILECLNEFSLWKTQMNVKDFVTALNEYNSKLSLARIMESPHEDNMKVLRALIYAKEDQLPLLQGGTNTRVSMEVLMRKHVLLLISNLSLSNNEILMLNQKYQESGVGSLLKRIESQFEMVWLPVVDESTPWTQAMEDQFENLQLKMPWYSVYHPSMIGPTVIMYIKEVWQFENKPILVVLDPQGKVINNNALHMLWIWGSHAFPFTRAREEELWRKEETWTVEFLVDGVDPAILIWIKENKYICLYGGEDIDWIRKFTSTAKEVAQAARIPLEMLYVGKSNPQEKVSPNISTIGRAWKKLSYSMEDLTSTWYFWVRLGSMRQSKKKLGRSVENDPIMQEIESLLSFDGNNQSWAMFCTRRGSAMAKAEGETMLECLNEFSFWKPLVKNKDFVTALNEYHNHKLSLAGIWALPVEDNMEVSRALPVEDNMEVSRALIFAKEDQLPLLQGATNGTKTRVCFFLTFLLYYFIWKNHSRNL